MRDLDLESLEEHKPPQTITIPDGINIKLDFFKRYEEQDCSNRFTENRCLLQSKKNHIKKN